MKKFSALIAITTLVSFSNLAQAQDYPYENEIPVESPTAEVPQDDEAPQQQQQTNKRRSSTPAKTSSARTVQNLFRMAVKGGANYTIFQDSGVSYNGPGFEGHLAFGWDLAYQPVFLETSVIYRQQVLNYDMPFPLRVVGIQQGLYYRVRLGKESQWKPGILSSLDMRIFKNATTGNSETSFNPNLGVTSLWEWGSFLLQFNVNIHRLLTDYAFVDGSALIGIKF